MQNNLVYQNIVRTFASLKQECRTCSKRNLMDKVRSNSRTLYQEFPTSACITSWIFLLCMFGFFSFSTKRHRVKTVQSRWISHPYIKLLLYTTNVWLDRLIKVKSRNVRNLTTGAYAERLKPISMKHNTESIRVYERQ